MLCDLYRIHRHVKRLQPTIIKLRQFGADTSAHPYYYLRKNKHAVEFHKLWPLRGNGLKNLNLYFKYSFHKHEHGMLVILYCIIYYNIISFELRICLSTYT